jgi:hypothetical protein
MVEGRLTANYFGGMLNTVICAIEKLEIMVGGIR